MVFCVFELVLFLEYLGVRQREEIKFCKGQTETILTNSSHPFIQWPGAAFGVFAARSTVAVFMNMP